MERLSALTEQLKNPPPGRLMARFIRGYVAGHGDPEAASEYAKRMRWAEADRLGAIFKTAVGAMNTGEPMAQTAVTNDLIALVQPLTVIGRLQGFKRVPNGVNAISQSAWTTAYWSTLGEGGAIPVSSPAYSRSMLKEMRCSAIAIVSDELVRVSRSSAEESLTRDVVNATVRKLDSTFLDPTNAGSPEESPASITRAAPQFASTGTTVALIDADLRLLLQSLSDGGSDLVNAAWVMNPRSAAYLASLRGSGGSPCYPGMGARGGELLGLPALTSAAVTRVGSPQETFLVLVDPSNVWLVDEGRAEVSVNGHTSLQMDDAPTGDSVAPTGTTVVSMFQTSSLAIRATRWVNWRATTAAAAAAVLTAVNF